MKLIYFYVNIINAIYQLFNILTIRRLILDEEPLKILTDNQDHEWAIFNKILL